MNEGKENFTEDSRSDSRLRRTFLVTGAGDLPELNALA